MQSQPRHHMGTAPSHSSAVGPAPPHQSSPAKPAAPAGSGSHGPASGVGVPPGGVGEFRTTAYPIHLLAPLPALSPSPPPSASLLASSDPGLSAKRAFASRLVDQDLAEFVSVVGPRPPLPPISGGAAAGAASVGVSNPASSALAPAAPALAASGEQAPMDKKKSAHPRFRNTVELVKMFEAAEEGSTTRAVLKRLVEEVIREFSNSPSHPPSEIRELVPLAACDDADIFESLFEAMTASISNAKLFPRHLVHAMGQMLTLRPAISASQSDNFVAMLEPLLRKLQMVRQEENQRAAMRSLSVLLDAICDNKGEIPLGEGSIRSQLMEKISDCLDNSSDPETVYLAMYMKETMRRISGGDPPKMSNLRKVFMVIEIFASVASLVASHGTDLSALFSIADNIKQLVLSNTKALEDLGLQVIASVSSGEFSGALETIRQAKDTVVQAVSDIQASVESVKEIPGYKTVESLVEQLKPVFGFKKKVSWYASARSATDAILLLRTNSGIARADELNALDQEIKGELLAKTSRWPFAFAVVRACGMLLCGSYARMTTLAVKEWCVNMIHHVLSLGPKSMKGDDSKQHTFSYGLSILNTFAKAAASEKGDASARLQRSQSAAAAAAAAAAAVNMASSPSLGAFSEGDLVAHKRGDSKGGAMPMSVMHAAPARPITIRALLERTQEHMTFLDDQAHARKPQPELKRLKKLLKKHSVETLMDISISSDVSHGEGVGGAPSDPGAAAAGGASKGGGGSAASSAVAALAEAAAGVSGSGGAADESDLLKRAWQRAKPLDYVVDFSMFTSFAKNLSPSPDDTEGRSGLVNTIQTYVPLRGKELGVTAEITTTTLNTGISADALNLFDNDLTHNPQQSRIQSRQQWQSAVRNGEIDRDVPDMSEGKSDSFDVLAFARKFLAVGTLSIPAREADGGDEEIGAGDGATTDWMDPSRRTLLVQGNAGGGKSLFLHLLEACLWAEYSYDSPIPLLISLPELENPAHNIVAQKLAQYGCDKAMIADFRRSRKFVFLLDGFDEIKTTSNILVSNRLRDWDCKVVITCRSEFLDGTNYETMFDLSGTGKGSAFADVLLQPFDEKQRKEYLKKLAASPHRQWQTADEYLEVMDSIPGLNSLVETPFNLVMVAEILPRLKRTFEEKRSALLLTQAQSPAGQMMMAKTCVASTTAAVGRSPSKAVPPGVQRVTVTSASGTGGGGAAEAHASAASSALVSPPAASAAVPAASAMRITRLAVYEEFTRHWFEREERRLRARSEAGKVSIPPRFNIRASFRAYSMDLAFSLFSENRTSVEAKPTSYEVGFVVRSSATNSFHRFFKDHTEDVKVFLAHEGAPLKESGGQCRFIHKSLMEYFVAALLINELDIICQAMRPVDKVTVDLYWNHKLLNSEPSVLLFLADRFGGQEAEKAKWVKGLMALLQGSKSNRDLGTAGANALTCLNYLRVVFSKLPMDLRDVQAPGANLTFALLQGANLTGANLRDANLSHALLFQTKLLKADLQDAILGKHSPIKLSDCGRDLMMHPVKPFFYIGEGPSIGVYDLSNGERLALHDVLNDDDDEDDGEQTPKSHTDTKTAKKPLTVVFQMCLTPDGSHLVVGDAQRKFYVFETTDFEQVGDDMEHRFASEPECEFVRTVEVSLDGHILMSSCWNQLVFWNLHQLLEDVEAGGTGEGALMPLRPPLMASDGIHCGVWHPRTKGCFAYGLDSGLFYVVGFHGNLGDSIFHHHHGKSAAFPNTIQLGHTSRNPQRKADGVQCLAFHPDNPIIAMGSEGLVIELWNLRTREREAQIRGHEDDVRVLTFSPSGQLLASGGSDGSVCVWDVGTRALTGAPLRGHTRDIRGLCFFNEESSLMSVGKDGQCILWDIEKTTAGLQLQGHDRRITSIVFDEDGTRMLSSSTDFRLLLWDLASSEDGTTTATCSSSHFRGKLPLMGCGFVPATSSIACWDDTKIFTCTSSSLQVYDKFDPVSDDMDEKEIYAAACCPSLRTYALLLDDDTLSLYTPPLLSASSPGGAGLPATDPVRSQRTQGGSRLVDSSTTSATTSSRQPQQQIQGVPGPKMSSFPTTGASLTSVQFNRTGNLLATGGLQHIFLWDVKALTLYSDWEVPNEPMPAKSDEHEIELRIDVVVFNQDSTLLASGGVNRHARLWEVPSGHAYGKAMNIDCPVTSLCFTGDGSLLAACGMEDPTIQIWRVCDQTCLLNYSWTCDTRIVSFAPRRRRAKPQYGLLFDDDEDGSGESAAQAVSRRTATQAVAAASSSRRTQASYSRSTATTTSAGEYKAPSPKAESHLLAVGDVEGTISLWRIEVGKDERASYKLMDVPSHRGMSIGVTKETDWESPF